MFLKYEEKALPPPLNNFNTFRHLNGNVCENYIKTEVIKFHEISIFPLI